MGWHPPRQSPSQPVFLWNDLVPLGHEVTKKTLDQSSSIVRALYALLQSLAEVEGHCGNCRRSAADLQSYATEMKGNRNLTGIENVSLGTVQPVVSGKVATRSWKGQTWLKN